MSPPRSGSRFSRALAAAPDAPAVFGLSFAPPAVLQALSGSPEPHVALPRLRESLKLDFAFVEHAAMPDLGDLGDSGCEPLAVVSGPLGRVLAEEGYTEGLLATVRSPDLLAPLLARAAEEALSEIDAASAAGAGAIVVAEDLAGTGGPIVAPDYAFAEVFPRLQDLVTRAGNGGLPCVLHTDGDARAFSRWTARAGFAAIHGGGGLPRQRLEPLIDDVRAAGLAFLGGILTSELGGGQMRAIAAGSIAGVQGMRSGVLVCDDGGMSTAEDAAAFASALHAARRSVERGGSGR